MTLVAMLFLLLGGAFAQTKVNGTVVSQDDGQPVIGASVMVVGTQVGTVTNADGRFSLTCPAGKNMLRITYVGMEPLEVSARPNMRILLTSDAKALDEVIVVAFGTAKKSAFTGSAKVVGSEELALSQVTSVTDALAGAVPGVTLTNESGDPSSTGKIRIRGFSSINAGQDPLIIVDGAPYSGDMANLNPADIESMTVLKDAASNALYGARGANGVIMITTKRAKQGQDATITVDAKWGANSRALRHYDVISSPAQYYELQYAAIRNQLVANGMDPNTAWQQANSVLGTAKNGGLGYNIWTVPAGQMLIGQDGRLNPNATLGNVVNYNGKDYLITPDDWEEEGTRVGIRQEYNINMSGSTDRSSFYMSLGYLKNEGLIQNSDMQRFTARLRADYQVKRWMKVGGNVSYARFDHNSLGNNGSETSTANPWAFTTEIAPIYPLYLRNADGSIMVDDDNILMMDYGNGMNAGMSRLFIQDANPLQDTKLNTRNSEGSAFNGSAFADFNLFDGLTFTVNGTVNLDESRQTYVYNPYYGQFDSTGGTVEKYHTRYFNYNLQQLLNYVTTFNDVHNLGVLLGHEYYNQRTYRLWGSKSKMFSQKNKELGGAAIDGQNAGSYLREYNNEGYFGRVQYDYDGRYFASASLRRDASSRFAPDHRWGTFWSVGGAWLINKEKWFNVNWIDELKLKASYGSQGNDNIGNYRYVDTYDIKNSAGSIGTEFRSKGTEGITWETNRNFNAGFEFQLFKRVTGSIEYYYRKTTDMLFSFSVAPSLGYSSYYDNVGDLYNTGIEADFNVNIIKKKDFEWNINLNFASMKNRITKLHEDKKNSRYYDADGKAYDGYVFESDYFVAEDNSIYQWYTKDFAGVDPETGESMWWKNTYEWEQAVDAAGNPLWDDAAKTQPTKVTIYYDKDGNKIADPDNYPGMKYPKWTGRERTKTYSDADYYIQEHSIIPKLQGGFGTSVRFRGFDLTANFTYQIGGKLYDETYSAFMTNPSNSHGGWNMHRDVLNAWQKDGDITDVPRWNYGDLYAAGRSNRFLTDASFLNLQNVNFGYTLPKSFTSKFDVQNLRVYVSAENVYYWSKRKGFDPRQSVGVTSETGNSNSPNATRYSPMRTISGGITVTF